MSKSSYLKLLKAKSQFDLLVDHYDDFEDPVLEIHYISRLLLNVADGIKLEKSYDLERKENVQKPG